MSTEASTNNNNNNTCFPRPSTSSFLIENSPSIQVMNGQFDFEYDHSEAELNEIDTKQDRSILNKVDPSKLEFLNLLVQQPIKREKPQYNFELSSFSQYPSTSSSGRTDLALYLNTCDEAKSRISSSKLVSDNLSLKKNSNSVSSDSTSSLSPTTISEQSSSTSPVASSPSSCIPVNTSPNTLKPDELLINKTTTSSKHIFTPILENNSLANSSSDEEIESSLKNQNKQESNRSQFVYTPDSLESSLSSTSSSLSNLFDKNQFTDKPTELQKEPKTRPIEIEDLEADEEIQQINQHKQTPNQSKNETKLIDTSLILEKIKKINQLQEKINDINNKIKHIDMSSGSNEGELATSNLTPYTTSSMSSSRSAAPINKSYYHLQQQDQFDSTSPEPEIEKTALESDDSIRCYVNPKYCEDDDMSDEESKKFLMETVDNDSFDEINVDGDGEDDDEEYDNRFCANNKIGYDDSYRSMNNQTRLGNRAKTVDEKNNEIFENITYNIYKSNSMDGNDLENDLEYIVNNDRRIGYIDERNCDVPFEEYNEDDGKFFDDDDDDDEDLFHNGSYVINGNMFKQAQPVHKKFASTGFLCHRFGSFLAPIEESQDEPPLQLDKGLNQLKNSTSCYDLVYEHMNKSTHNDQELTETNTITCDNLKLSYSKTSFINKTYAQDEISSSIPTSFDYKSNQLTVANVIYDSEADINQPADSNMNETYIAVEVTEVGMSDEEDPEYIENKAEQMRSSGDELNSSCVPDSLAEYSEAVPEDNVERLRNIRDMFENSELEEQLLLQKVERVQPSEKIMSRLTSNMHEFEFNDLENIEINNNNPIDAVKSVKNTEQNKGIIYSVSEDSNVSGELADNNSDQDSEEFVKNIYETRESEIVQTMVQSEKKPDNSDSILTKMENSNLIIEKNKEAQRSINGDNLELNDNQTSSATSSVSSSTSISSTTCDEQVIELKPNQEPENTDNELHVESVNIIEINEECIDSGSDNNKSDIRFQDGLVNEDEIYDDDEEYEEGVTQEELLMDLKAKRLARKKEKVIPFAEMNNVMSKFENMGNGYDDRNGPKPVRSITPPRRNANKYEIENTPAPRAEGVVGANDKVEDVQIRQGLIRSRKLAFVEQNANESGEKKANLLEDIAPGSAKNAAAMFNNSVNEQNDRWANRLKNIEKSGITIEGEVVEKGLAQARLAMFTEDIPPVEKFHTPTVSELDSEIFQSASGIAKDRMNLFKNLEQKGVNKSPSREFKKMKEFTPPPQLDTTQRQYIIIDKEGSPSNDDVTRHDSYTKEDFIPETGLAKNRMKQYLESSQNNGNDLQKEKEEIVGKGYAKSLLAKWKSMEHMEGKEGSPEPRNGMRRLSKEGSPGSVDFINQDGLVEQGHARNLRKKWQNIDANGEQMRKPLRQITPPPSEDLQRNKQLFEAPQEIPLNKTVNTDQELNLIGKGSAKSRLAKFEQSVAESNTHIRKTVTPPREYINKALNNQAEESVYESSPVDSCINAQFCEEDVIPSAGHAKNLKNKFLNLEKEASKVETSSSKMNYKPKKFTSSSTTPQSNSTKIEKEKAKVKKIDAARLAEVAAGPEKPKDTSAKDAAVSQYLSQHTSTLHGGDKCCVCDKTVYAMEKIEANGKIYHKLCFKCTACNCLLNGEDYVFENGVPFCLIHATKTPVSPAKGAKSPIKGKGIEPLQTIHIDTTSSFDSDTNSLKSPSFSPISPIKAKISPKPVQSPKKF